MNKVKRQQLCRCFEGLVCTCAAKNPDLCDRLQRANPGFKPREPKKEAFAEFLKAMPMLGFSPESFKKEFLKQVGEDYLEYLEDWERGTPPPNERLCTGIVRAIEIFIAQKRRVRFPVSLLAVAT